MVTPCWSSGAVRPQPFPRASDRCASIGCGARDALHIDLTTPCRVRQCRALTSFEPGTGHLDRDPRLQRGGDPARSRGGPRRPAERLPWSYELVLAENGSTDRTVEVAAELAERFDQLGWRHTDEPNYGKALREGILHARGDIVICDEIDLCDTDFYERAVALLQDSSVDFVVGSKVMEGAMDERPFFGASARS